MTNKFTRRELCVRLGAGLAVTSLPMQLTNALECPSEFKTMVVVFLRGAADGLSLVVPRGDEANYEALRRNDATGNDITIPPAGTELQLDGFFELHPSLAPFKSLYDAGEMSMVHAMGGANDYSHFTAQDSIERVMPGAMSQSVSDGWVNLALQELNNQGSLCAPIDTLNGVTLGSRMSKSLAGAQSQFGIAFSAINKVNYTGTLAEQRAQTLLSIFGNDATLTGNSVRAAFAAIDTLEGVASQPPAVTYPSNGGALGKQLQDAARLIKNPQLGVRAITIDTGGWDHHSNLLPQIDSLGTRLAEQVSSFWQDIGDAKSRTCVLLVTEFGRTAHVNGNGGTDHGWGNAMFMLSGAMNGGQVFTRADPADPTGGIVTPSGQHWPGLALSELHQQPQSGQPRDLKSTTDYRDVFGEVLQRFVGLPEQAVSEQILRGYTPNFVGLFD